MLVGFVRGYAMQGREFMAKVSRFVFYALLSSWFCISIWFLMRFFIWGGGEASLHIQYFEWIVKYLSKIRPVGLLISFNCYIYIIYRWGSSLISIVLGLFLFALIDNIIRLIDIFIGEGMKAHLEHSPSLIIQFTTGPFTSLLLCLPGFFVIPVFK